MNPESLAAAGKVLLHFSMSLDGFIAGPDHNMDWLGAVFSRRAGLIEEYVDAYGSFGGRCRGGRRVVARVMGGEGVGGALMITARSTCAVRKSCPVRSDCVGARSVSGISP